MINLDSLMISVCTNLDPGSLSSLQQDAAAMDSDAHVEFTAKAQSEGAQNALDGWWHWVGPIEKCWRRRGAIEDGIDALHCARHILSRHSVIH